MYQEIVPLLKCPNCNKPLHLVDPVLEAGEIVQGNLKFSCEETWEIREGILDFRVEEQESVNRWSELTKVITFEELDEMILSKNVFTSKLNIFTNFCQRINRTIP